MAASTVRGFALCAAKFGLRSTFTLRSYHFTPPTSPTKALPSLLPLIISSSNLELSRGTLHDPEIPYRVSSRSAERSSIDEEVVVPFLISIPRTLDDQPVGFLRSTVFDALNADHDVQLSTKGKSPWIFESTSTRAQYVSFAPWVNEEGWQCRTSHMHRLVSEWKERGMFTDILRGWSNEPYPVYSHLTRTGLPSSDSDPVAFSIERAALPLFGFANFGCLLTGFFRSPVSGETMIWVPRRSRTKRTWPGRLDVTVGGGIGIGDTAFSTVVRESAEEASLDANYVRSHVRPVGVLPFPNRSPAGWILPGLYYLFDLPLPSDGSIHPRVNEADGEVENFELMNVETVLKNLHDGMFKPSSALALVDFMIRHGFVTDESDPRFVQICLEMRKEVVLPLPWR